MAFPDGWGRKHSIIIDNTKVSGSGSHSGFIVFLISPMWIARFLKQGQTAH